MISVNDLRIGNWILEDGEPSMVYSLESGGISFYKINDIPVNKETGCTLNGGQDRFNPIPLTPSILSACGFTPLSDPEFTHHHPELNILFDGEFFWLKQGKVTHYLSKCEHLHKLQNGVFWVTGKELIVNIEKVKV